MLMAINTHAPRNVATYNYRERKFELNTLLDQLEIHFSMDGDQILMDSEDAKVIEDIQDSREKAFKEALKKEEFDIGEGTQKDKNKKVHMVLRNKFNYGERETQTPSLLIREKGMSTEKPMKHNFAMEINQAMIYDRYMRDLEENNKEKDDKKGAKAAHEEATGEEAEEKLESFVYKPSFARCLKIMERMIVENDDDQKYNDYKYMFTSNSGMENQKKIYGLWRVSHAPNKRKAVTCLEWNPKYKDMFVAGFGTYEFGKKKFPGSICCFSIKNVTYPEFVYQTEEPVMALNFHPKAPYLLAVGMYYGTVLVFDLRYKSKKPLYQSSVKTSKHTDVVWQVAWDSDISKNYSFYSISADGRVMRWVLMKNKLEPEEVIRLKLVNKSRFFSILDSFFCFFL
jgi:dynein intermediate chain 1